MALKGKLLSSRQHENQNPAEIILRQWIRIQKCSKSKPKCASDYGHANIVV